MMLEKHYISVVKTLRREEWVKKYISLEHGTKLIVSVNRDTKGSFLLFKYLAY